MTEGKPRGLFEGRFAGLQLTPDFNVALDGQRFIRLAPEGDGERKARTQVILVFRKLEVVRRMDPGTGIRTACRE